MVLGGLCLLLYVGWQLWGTGLSTARAQTSLRAELAQGFPARPVPGHALGIIRIPRIHLNMAFVQGISPDALARGPGHYPATPLPGQGGNVAIAGHRTTHLHPFGSLDSLKPGDRIVLSTRAGTFVYRVVWTKVILPGDLWVLRPTGVASLTLTTCNPRFSARERLVVRAVQVEGAIPGGVMRGGRTIV